MRFFDLSVLVLHQETPHPVDNAGNTTTDCRTSRWLDTDETRRLVDEPGEDADRIRTTANTRHDDIGIGARQCSALLARLVADHAVKFAYHPGIRVGSHDRSEAIVSVTHSGNPIAHRLIHGILQRPAARTDRFDLAAEQAHAEHVQCLSFDVDGAHVHLALEAEQRGGRG